VLAGRLAHHGPHHGTLQLVSTLVFSLATPAGVVGGLLASKLAVAAVVGRIECARARAREKPLGPTGAQLVA
jgi:hypothetical protein